MRFFIKLILAAILPLPTFAEKPEVAFEKEMTRSYLLAKAKDFNPRNLERERKVLLSLFSSPSDQAYIRKNLKEIKAIENFKFVVTDENHLQLLDGQKLMVTFSGFEIGSKEFLINGKSFQMKSGESIESATNRISKLINIPKSTAASKFSLLIPSAHAYAAAIFPVIGGLFSLVLVGERVYRDSLTAPAYEALGKVAVSCKVRNPGIPYEQSTTKTLFETEMKKLYFDHEQAAKSKVCEAWAIENESTTDPRFFRGELKFICEYTKSVYGCISNYKAGLAPAAAAAAKPPAKAASEVK